MSPPWPFPVRGGTCPAPGKQPGLEAPLCSESPQNSELQPLSSSLVPLSVWVPRAHFRGPQLPAFQPAGAAAGQDMAPPLWSSTSSGQEANVEALPALRGQRLSREWGSPCLPTQAWPRIGARESEDWAQSFCCPRTRPILNVQGDQEKVTGWGVLGQTPPGSTRCQGPVSFLAAFALTVSVDGLSPGAWLSPIRQKGNRDWDRAADPRLPGPQVWAWPGAGRGGIKAVWSPGEGQVCSRPDTCSQKGPTERERPFLHASKTLHPAGGQRQ